MLQGYVGVLLDLSEKVNGYIMRLMYNLMR